MKQCIDQVSRVKEAGCQAGCKATSSQHPADDVDQCRAQACRSTVASHVHGTHTQVSIGAFARHASQSQGVKPAGGAGAWPPQPAGQPPQPRRCWQWRRCCAAAAWRHPCWRCCLHPPLQGRPALVLLLWPPLVRPLALSWAKARACMPRQRCPHDVGEGVRGGGSSGWLRPSGLTKGNKCTAQREQQACIQHSPASMRARFSGSSHCAAAAHPLPGGTPAQLQMGQVSGLCCFAGQCSRPKNIICRWMSRLEEQRRGG